MKTDTAKKIMLPIVITAVLSLGLTGCKTAKDQPAETPEAAAEAAAEEPTEQPTK